MCDLFFCGRGEKARILSAAGTPWGRPPISSQGLLFRGAPQGINAAEPGHPKMPVPPSGEARTLLSAGIFAVVWGKD
jgi:hypothetical protein